MDPFLFFLTLWAASAAAAAAAFAFAWSSLTTKYRRQLESAEATWHLQHQRASPGTVIEHVSTGWLNLLLQSLWTPVLEKHVAGLTTELLHKVFLEVLTKGSQKAPWKYLDSIEVEELSFGLVPPNFQVASAKFDPVASMLTLSMDVRFTSSSAQAVLLARSKAVTLLAPMTVRMEVTHVKLRGRLRLGLVLGQEAPGIQGMYYSFVSPPHLDVAVRPLGLPLPSVMPGVDTALRGVLSKLISRRMVEPQRRYLDVHRIYLNKHIARVGGPGGLLRLMVLNASNMCVQTQQQQQEAAAAAVATAAGGAEAARGKGSKGSGKAAASSAAAGPKLSSYCEVRFGQTVLRTPIVHTAGSADAAWNWQFSLALPFELDAWPAADAGAAPAGGGSIAAGGGRGSAGSRRSSDELYVTVYDAQAVGQPVLLGRTKVSLCPLQLQPNGPARTLVLPLHKASSGRAAVQLSVQWLKSTKQPQQQRPPPATQQGRSLQQGQRVVVPPPVLGQPQQSSPRTALPPAQPVSRAASAVSPSSKSVSWQDKTQLRAKSAAAAAKRSFRQLTSGSPADKDELQHLQDGVTAAVDAASASAGSSAAGSTIKASTQQQQPDAGPWRSSYNTASDDATSSQATSTDEPSEQQPGAARAGQHTSTRSPAHAQEHAGAPYLVEPDHSGASAEAAAASGSSWLWKGLGAWIWPTADGAEQQPSVAGTRSPSPQVAMRPSSSSPWPTGPDGESDGEVCQEDGWDAEPAGGPSLAGSSPLALLSHVVHMQRELEQQRAQLQAMQQQLDHTGNSYQKLKQLCRQRCRAALLQGARFVLHKADGSTQHVLLYLAHAGSARGVQPSRLGRQQQQQPEHGMALVLAALPETRREARLAFKRIAAGAGADAAEGAGGGLAGPAANSSNHPASGTVAAAAAAAGGGSAGGVSGAGDRPRLSAFGSVGAGLRLQRGTMLQMGYDSGKFPRSALQQLKAVPACQLVGVVRGSSHFAGTASSGGAAGTAAPVGSAAECFTLLVQEDSSGCVTAINLQLPPVGNGRSLDEWLLALRDVAVAVQPAAAAAVTVPASTAAAAAAFAGAGGSPDSRFGRAAGLVPAVGAVAGVSAAPVAALQPLCEAETSTAQLRHSLEHAAATLSAAPGQPAAAGAEQPPPAAPVYRIDSAGAQQTLEGRDWLLPAAASAMPKPWAGASPGATGGATHDDSSSDSASDTDTDDM